ncbi:proton-coupled zinc antiporter SLC30A1 isoform X2 [Syngnathus scovelli]|nr:zinc transporter 1 isoform X2 [Syngnathus scovelli]
MKKLSHYCLLVITILVLVLKLIIGQLCRSFILLVDGFHTLFVLGHMALPQPQNAASPPASKLSSETTDLAGVPPYAASYPHGRRRPVGVFISALLLVSLCVSCLLEIISHQSVGMHPVEQPWLLAAAGVVGLLHNVMVLVMTWRRRGAGAQAGREHECYIEVNHIAMSQEGSEGADEVERGPCEASGDESGTTARSLHNWGLVPCNPVTSVGGGVVAEKTTEEPKSGKEVPRDTRQRLCPASVVMVVQGLSTSVLVLVNSLVMLLVGPDFRHSPGACSLLVYLDPSLAVLAAIILVGGAVPQMHRYGLLLMQATPPHVSLSDVRKRIGIVPGVEELHELHIWELSDSCLVASVHVLCHADFPVHRCADLMSGVTKVLQSVGVSCCTVQPEFATSSALPKDPTCPGPGPACRLACDKICDAHMCCPLPPQPVMEKVLKQESQEMCL